MSRLDTLEGRYDRLLEANQVHQYVYSEKIDRYLNALRKIKNEMASIQREQHSKLDKSNYKFTITREDMFNLTKPL